MSRIEYGFSVWAQAVRAAQTAPAPAAPPPPVPPALRLLPVVAPRLELDDARPRTRGDCAAGPRPCPWVSCRHHLYLDVTKDQIRFPFPQLEVWELAETCSLDVAEHGGEARSGMGPGRLLEEVGAVMNITRERVRQLEVKAKKKMKKKDRVGGGALASEANDQGLHGPLGSADAPPPAAAPPEEEDEHVDG